MMLQGSIRRGAMLVAIVLAIASAGCRSEPDTPEAQVRAWVADMEEAAEEKDAGAVKALISDRYRDGEGFDRQTLMAIVLRQFLRNESIHVVARVRSVAIEGGQARVVVFAGMAGQAVASPADLAGLRADIYRFEIELGEESPRQWKLTRAAWRPAELEDVE